MRCTCRVAQKEGHSRHSYSDLLIARKKQTKETDTKNRPKRENQFVVIEPTHFSLLPNTTTNKAPSLPPRSLFQFSIFLFPPKLHFTDFLERETTDF